MATPSSGVAKRKPTQVPGTTPWSRAVRRATVRLMHAFSASVTFEQLERRYLVLKGDKGRGEPDGFGTALDQDFKDLRARHMSGLGDDDPGSFRTQVRYLLDQLRPQQKKRKGVAAGPDDNRMRGISDARYQCKLSTLAAEQCAANARLDAARYESLAARFVTGTEATVNNSEQAACIAELLWLIGTGGPTTIAVQQWSESMMGRAAMAVNKELQFGAEYVGDCTQVVNLQLKRGRPQGSAYIAQRWLRQKFPERSRQGAYDDKAYARKVLAQEIQRKGLGRLLCFLDAATLRFEACDWNEAKLVAITCNAIVIISVECEGDVPTGVPCIGAPVESTDRPRAHVRELQDAAKSSPAELPRQLYELMHSEEFCERERKRKLDVLAARVGELEKRELTPEQMQRLRGARAVLQEGGAYVSDSEASDDEDESELEELCRRVCKERGVHRGCLGACRDDGHYRRCCEARCVCPYNTGIGAGSKGGR